MLITNPERLRCFYADHRVWQGIPGIERTRKGRTFLCFYSGGTTEEYGNFAVIVRSEDGISYSEPVAAVWKPGDFRCFDPVLWIDPLHRLWFLWNVMPGEEVWASICEDPDAETLQWGPEFLVGRGILMNKPTVLSSGAWMFPIAIWPFSIMNHLRAPGLLPEDEPGSFVWITEDQGKTFRRLGGVQHADQNCDEHMVLERNDGSIRMLIRTNYGIGEAHSTDQGVTWISDGDSGIRSPISRFFLRRLRSGRVLLIHHKDFTGRNNLTAFLSEDDGRTFPYSLLLDERNKVSYPDAVEGEDGFLYVVYDRERGYPRNTLEEAYADAREILVAKITEEDILCGALCTEGSVLKRVAVKLNALAEDAPNPFLQKKGE